ncbi:MAG TPA: glycoside hydrolase family 3 N-terminal domain-containing protein [Gemmatimonadaceae bacterium]|nr:glycoside hydrolase family 3 N-terminal domain-containing protein [Gemmatimonadaceae bacterium]
MLALGACAHLPSAARGESSADAWADSVLATLTPRERAAQLVWPQLFGDYTAEGSASWQRISNWVANERIGGFVMSIGSPVETAVKLNALQGMARVPILVGADYEDGAGFRTRGGHFLPNAIYLGGATVFPKQMALGAAGDTALAYAQGRITAIEGRAVGVHMAFAPVLDVNNNPNNPVIGPRSFGEDPAVVSRMGVALIRGLQENGMLATAKHFPGHGDTDRNSHLSITEVNASRPRLDSVELVPFRRAIASGVAAVMTFHGVVPALDTTPVPATLSPVVMNGLLRRDMGFDGLLITDALDMNGVLARVRPAANATPLTGNYGTIDSPGLAEVVKLAVIAGNDVLLMPLDVPTAIDAVVNGVREGRFTQARVDASARRILRMKRQLGLHRDRFVDVDSVRSRVGTSANLAAADTAAQRAITLAKDSLQLVPLASTAGKPNVLSITIANRVDLGAGTTFDAELRNGANVRSLWVDPTDPLNALARAAALADSVESVVIGAYLAQGTTVANANAPDAVSAFIRAVHERKPRTILVAFGNPYLLQNVPFVSSYVVAWGGFPPSQRAAARALIGASDITGRLPISIPPLLRLGAGDSRRARITR